MYVRNCPFVDRWSEPSDFELKLVVMIVPPALRSVRASVDSRRESGSGL